MSPTPQLSPSRATSSEPALASWPKNANAGGVVPLPRSSEALERVSEPDAHAPVQFPAPVRLEAATLRGRPQHLKRRLLFAYEGDASSSNIDDGLAYWTRAHLSQSERVADQFPVRARPSLSLSVRAVGRALRGAPALWMDVEPRMLASRQRHLSGVVRSGSYHGVFAPSSVAVTHLGANSSVVFSALAPFGAMAASAPDALALPARSRDFAFEQERAALARCAGAVYPTQWAAEAAQQIHGADPSKLHVIPFGANVTEPDAQIVADALSRRPSRPEARFVMVAEDWELGRCDLIIEAVRRAWPRRGARLDIVLRAGAPVPRNLPACVRVHRLPKRGKGAARDAVLSPLLKAASVFVAPSLGRSAAYDLNAVSAAAWGVPVVAAEVGGMDAIVAHEGTGVLLPKDADAQAYATVLKTLAGDDVMQAMGALARVRYEERMSWDRFTVAMAGVLDAAMSQDTIR